jgi:diguanylate cyclase (GGDEF)-like protein
VKQSVREVDTVARLGGDEFAVIFDGVVSLRDISEPLERILQRFTYTLLIDGNEIHIGASIGVAFYPLDAGNSRDLERRADSALLEAKRAGRGRYQYYRRNALIEPGNVVGVGV